MVIWVQVNSSSKLTGLTRSNATRLKMSKSKTDLPDLTCPHCGKKGKFAGMKRWHFDNCRHKEASRLTPRTS